MSKETKISVAGSHEGQVMEITLDEPKGNVLDGAMMREITAAIERAAANPALKAIVFQGAGEHFSFGASVPEHRKAHVAEMLRTFHELFRTLIRSSKPSLAVVRGQCLGGGLELAAFCNWIFASPDAKFGQPEIRLAVFPPVASVILPHRIGQSAADDLILTGRSISAEQAKVLGLVAEIAGDPYMAAMHFIEKHLLPQSAVALQYTVKAARFQMHAAFLQHIDALEAMYVQELMETADANEGIEAFLEKRRPVWQNR